MPGKLERLVLAAPPPQVSLPQQSSECHVGCDYALKRHAEGIEQ